MESKKNNPKKIIFIVIWVIALITFVVLVARVRLFGMAGKFYNQGNSYFKQGDYEMAENRYSRAIIERFSKGLECRLMINYALSITTPITPESVTSENLEESIARLEEAISILVYKGCANLDDSKGHNRKAQILKEEIEDYIKWLRENVPPPDEQSSGPDNENSENTKQNDEQREAAVKKQNDLREQFDMIQQEGMNERMREQNSRGGMGTSGYYDGKNW